MSLFKSKLKLIFWISVGVTSCALAVWSIVRGVMTERYAFVVAGVMWLFVYFKELIKGIKQNKQNTLEDGEIVKSKPLTEEERLARIEPDLVSRYQSVTEQDYKYGYVSMLNEGLTFSALGKYGCVENFKGVKGFHFGFSVTGTSLVQKPINYDDVCDYESLLFSINIAYHDGFLLSDQENDTGVILKDYRNLQGTKVKISYDKGYMAYFVSNEIDDIDVGELEFYEWNNSKKTIRFKLLVDCGIHDVVVGMLDLTEDVEQECLK